MAAADRIGAGADAPSAGTLSWETAFSLATNRFVIYDMLKVIAITWGIMLVLFGVIALATGNTGAFSLFVIIDTAIMLGFLLMFMLIMLVFFGNRYPARFTLTPNGARWENLSGRARAANRLAMAAGALAARPGVTGAGMIAASQEVVSLQWSSVGKAREHPDQRVISLMNHWRVVVRLYCTPENYAAAREYVRAHTGGVA